MEEKEKLFKSIFVGVDGSYHSDLAIDAAIKLAKKFPGTKLIGGHIYATAIHRTRFAEMEPGLPDRYQSDDKLTYLRNTHEDLISNGMDLISDAYLKPLHDSVTENNIPCDLVTGEGRNYLKLVEVLKKDKADLLIFGAQGHGRIPEENLGSVVERVLTHVPNSNMLIMRQPLNLKGRPIVVGVDGSDDSYHALEIAFELAKAFDTTVRAVAVYDPFFHIGVFRKIAEVLSPKDQKKFNFTAQEAIHDEIIDKGLEKLYKEGLDRGNLIAESKKVKYESEVLLGKALSKINHYAAAYEAGLIVLGRWGRHKEHISLIGSNSIKCARLSNSNILITAPPETPLNLPNLPKAENSEDLKEIEWTPEALKVLERIPKFVRNMAKKSIENRAREKNMDKVDADLINEVAKKMGMR